MLQGVWHAWANDAFVWAQLCPISRSFLRIRAVRHCERSGAKSLVLVHEILRSQSLPQGDNRQRSRG